MGTVVVWVSALVAAMTREGMGPQRLEPRPLISATASETRCRVTAVPASGTMQLIQLPLPMRKRKSAARGSLAPLMPVNQSALLYWLVEAMR